MVPDAYDQTVSSSGNVCLDAVVTAVVESENRMRPLRLECRRIMARYVAGEATAEEVTRYLNLRLELRMLDSARTSARLPHGAAEVLARRAELAVEAIAGDKVSAA